MKKLLIIILFLAFTSEFYSQVNTYYLTNWNPSSQWHYNPALQSKEKVFFYVPLLSGIHLKAGHTGFSYNDAVTNKSIDVSSLIDDLEDTNHFFGEFHTDLIGLGVKFGNVQLRAGATAVFESRLGYSKGLLELLWKGNGHEDVIGKRVSMDGTGTNMISYGSYFLGGSVSLLDNTLNLGLNARMNSGAATVYTEESVFGLRTNADNYHITADGSFSVFTSGTGQFEDEIDPQMFDPFSGKGNNGIGLDLGLTYSPVESFTIEASARNLGKINWKNDLKNYELSEQEITYSGYELSDFLSQPDSAQSSIEQFGDSISDLFSPTENMKEFSTRMNSEFFVKGIYNVSESVKVSAFLSSRKNFDQNFTSGGALFSKSLGNTLLLRGGVQLFRMKDVLIPVGLIVNAGPVQLGLHTDNVVSVFNPKATKHVSGMFSIGFRIGKERNE